MKAVRVALALAVCLIGGCGPYYTPVPTTKKVNPAALVGQWRYRSGVGVNVDLTLYSNSTFRQATRLNGKVITRKGWWSVDGSDLVLSRALALTKDNRFTTAELTLWIIDDSSSTRPFGIFGQDDWRDIYVDPDSGSYFERIS